MATTKIEEALSLLNDLTSQNIQFRGYEDIKDLPATIAILNADEQTRLVIVRECSNRIGAMADRIGPISGQDHRYMNLYHEEGFPWEGRILIPRLLRKKLPWKSEDISFVLNRIADLGMTSTFALPFLTPLTNFVERWLDSNQLTEELQIGLVRLAKAIRWIKYRSAEGRLYQKLTALATRPIEVVKKLKRRLNKHKDKSPTILKCVCFCLKPSFQVPECIQTPLLDRGEAF